MTNALRPLKKKADLAVGLNCSQLSVRLEIKPNRQLRNAVATHSAEC